MTRKQKLKVFRTPIGFHDAYVAAPSQKAALEAWGSDHDLFARGVAERVENPELTREPLEKPGTVIRRLRGTTAEQLAALPPDAPRRRGSEKPAGPIESATPHGRAPARKSDRAKSAPGPKPAPKPKPRPDRAALDRAEQALTGIEERQAREREELARRQAELDRERRMLEKRQESERAKVARQADKARDAYERAMRAWRG